MRLFIALPLPDAVRAELAAVQEGLRRAALPVRWVAPANLHLTLQFLGETDPALVDPLIAALQTLDRQALELRLGTLGAFPNQRAPRVIWVGLAGYGAGVQRLHAAVIQATAPLGFTPEARPLHPHLTLGRVRPDATPEQLRRISAALAAAEPPAAYTWQSAGPLLYASTLTPQGAVYKALGPEAQDDQPPT